MFFPALFWTVFLGEMHRHMGGYSHAVGGGAGGAIAPPIFWKLAESARDFPGYRWH